MIYLIAKGGLCNRMRAIDSMLSLCKRYNRDLIIIWGENKDLNCAFNDLFMPLTSEGFKLQIVNTHRFQFVPKKGIIRIPIMGYLAPGVKINKRISNSTLAKLYSSKDHIGDVSSIRESDAIFYSKTEPIVASIFESNQGSYLLESCYRLCPNENNYTSFQPVSSILQKIDRKVSEFNNTIGLHIRRTDHDLSSKFSTTDKFVKIIHKTLKSRPEKTFFLSSDSNQTKQRLINEFGDKIIANNFTVYNRNNCEAIKDAMLDLYCLSKTEKIYGSYWSSFSQVGADLGKIEEISVL